MLSHAVEKDLETLVHSAKALDKPLYLNLKAENGSDLEVLINQKLTFDSEIV